MSGLFFIDDRPRYGIRIPETGRRAEILLKVPEDRLSVRLGDF
jgi:hypothetical protein